MELADKNVLSCFKYAPYLNMLKKIRGKHKHDEERNRRYEKNPIVFREIYSYVITKDAQIT